MLRTRSLATVAAQAVRRTAAGPVCVGVPRPAAIVRSFSIFASEGPESLSKVTQAQVGMTGADYLDQSVPLGAPKPSVLNKLRTSGRNSAENQERRAEAVEAKLRKAQEYKAQKKAAEAAAAKAKADADAAKKQ